MESNETKVISAGIDIGTTTFQMIISELTLKVMGSSSKISATELVDKKIIYESSIYLTPITDHRIINSKRIKEIIGDEYNKAGFKISDIETGALIITGETAKKENAKLIINDLAEFSGNFVTAVAGPELESILAGKGSGAAVFSKKNYKTVMNIDIGGGTTNISIFKNGEFIDSTCINIGGRLIEVDKNSGIVTYIHKPAQLIMDTYDIDIQLGNKLKIEYLEELCDKMVDLVQDVINRENINPQLKDIILGSPLSYDFNSQYIFFSGGVAELIYNNYEDGFLYGDIGYYLAKSYSKNKYFRTHKIMKPIETIRATVVGTGTQSIRVSGNTVFIDKGDLPLRNIPVIKVKSDEFIKDNIIDGLNRFVLNKGTNYIAIHITNISNISFNDIQSISRDIYEAWILNSNSDIKLIIIMDKNIGEVLGQTIYKISNKKLKVMSIDSINVQEGDFIDIGVPVAYGDVVPVVIKTLLFN